MNILNRINCPKCHKDIVFKDMNNNGMIFCNYCGSKLKISIQVLSEGEEIPKPLTFDLDIGGENDDLYDLAIKAVREAGGASATVLQNKLGVGYARANKLIDTLEKNGIIGPFNGSKPRTVL